MDGWQGIKKFRQGSWKHFPSDLSVTKSAIVQRKKSCPVIRLELWKREKAGEESNKSQIRN